MLRFLIRRIALGILVMWMVTVLVFGIFFIGGNGGEVARRLAGRNATLLTLANITHRLHLDKPLVVQYWEFIKQLVWHHNLGYSYYHGQPVSTVLREAFPVTLSLALGAAVIWLVLGVLSGVVSAVRRGSVLDRVLTFLALFFYSLPTFVLGLLLLFLVYFQLAKRGIRIFPGSGYVPLTSNPLKWLESLTLPWLTLALVSAATYTRLTRGSLLEVLSEDYIRTARSKGLGERRVIFRHGLRSALTPVASQFGIDLGTLVGGAIVTESVFGLPGLGFTAIRSITNQDLPVIIGIVIVASAAVIVANILVDIVYAVLDPRVRLH
ncbi:MAG TPA: ABC transporter permease [Acidimicrobiales bacterium]|nr:ABC transporter permease [Acidimicrobiales bacterium]